MLMQRGMCHISLRNYGGGAIDLQAAIDKSSESESSSMGTASNKASEDKDEQSPNNKKDRSKEKENEKDNFQVRVHLLLAVCRMRLGDCVGALKSLHGALAHATKDEEANKDLAKFSGVWTTGMTRAEAIATLMPPDGTPKTPEQNIYAIFMAALPGRRIDHLDAAIEYAKMADVSGVLDVYDFQWCVY
jgi:hypothetical protein